MSGVITVHWPFGMVFGGVYLFYQSLKAGALMTIQFVVMATICVRIIFRKLVEKDHKENIVCISGMRVTDIMWQR
jgi:hypothetical protein